MKYCAFCGMPLDDEAKICNACGKQVEEEPETTLQSAAAENPGGSAENPSGFTLSQITEIKSEQTAKNQAKSDSVQTTNFDAQMTKQQQTNRTIQPNVQAGQNTYADNPYRQNTPNSQPNIIAQQPQNFIVQPNNNQQYNSYGQPAPYNQPNNQPQGFTPQNAYGSGYFSSPEFAYPMPKGTNKYGLAGLIASLVSILFLIILFGISMSLSAELLANHPELAQNPDLLNTHPELFEEEIMAYSGKIFAMFALLILSCILGIIFSAIGLSRKQNYKNSGTATAGIVISCIVVFIGLFVII